MSKKTLSIKIPFDTHRRLKILSAIKGSTVKDLATQAIEKFCNQKEGEKQK